MGGPLPATSYYVNEICCENSSKLIANENEKCDETLPTCFQFMT